MIGVVAMVVQLLVTDAGIASMHTAVLHTGTVMFLDRTNVGPSHMKLANGVCRNSTSEMVSPPAVPHLQLMPYNEGRSC